jgi:hypothetical protein
MSEHAISTTHHDGTTKTGRPKRSYMAFCSCGWESRWIVSKSYVQSLGDEHVAEHQPTI